jgi:hydroxymethylbilane synthase
VLDRPLAAIGGKGLFVKYLEQILLEGKADAAVHSGKDMEAHLAPGTELAAILPRADRRDALIGSYAKLDELPHGAKIGTASVRRAAIICHHRPDLKPVLLRGSVNTRLNALKNGQYDAIILAMAGLQRLGITEDVHPISEDVMLPAAAQGAIMVQARSAQTEDGEDKRRQQVLSAFNGIHDAVTGAEVLTERLFLETLDGSCRTPIGASAHLKGEQIYFRGLIASPDGFQCFTDEATVPVGDAAQMAKDMAFRLLEQAGGHDFLLQADKAIK